MKKQIAQFREWLAKRMLEVDRIFRSNKKVVTDYVNDPKVIENAREMAIYLHKLYTSRWITPGYVAKTQKVLKSEEEVFETLRLLSLIGFAISRVEGGIEKFRIVVDNKDKISTYQQMLKEVETEGDKIRKEIAKLKK